MSTTENPKSAKGPITLKIKFKSASLEQFIERYSVDVSRGGIFIRTKEPLAVASVLKFEFQLQDATSLLAGDGTVVWSRPYDATRPSVAPGMGVRFDKLTPDSQRVLERILGEKDRRGDLHVESRFDAGVRQAAGGPEPASNQTPKQEAGMFGDEPTRAMAADQVNKLQEAMQSGGVEEDQPTRRGSMADLGDEVRRIAGGSSDASGSLPAIPHTALPTAPAAGTMQPMKRPEGLSRTLMGQGFGLKPAATPAVGGGISGPLVAPNISREPSGVGVAGPALTAPAPALDSQVTPVRPAAPEQMAESQRTPTSLRESSRQVPVPAASPAAVAQTAAASAEAAVAMSAQAAALPEPVRPAGPAIGTGSEAASGTAGSEPRPPAPSETPQKSGSGKAIGIGAAVLAVAVAGYFALQGPKPVSMPQASPDLATPAPIATPTGPATTPDPAHPVNPNDPVVKTGPDKPVEPTGEKPATTAVEPKAPTGHQFTTEPAGASLTVAGKVMGTTPVQVPDLKVGQAYDVRVTLPGYETISKKITAGAESQPIQLTLTKIPRQIDVVSVPKGAEVWLDGKRVGKTPWIIRDGHLAQPLEVQLRKLGYVPFTRTVSPTDPFVLRNKKESLTVTGVLIPMKRAPRPAAKAPDAGTVPISPTQSSPGTEPGKTEEIKPEPAKTEAPKPEPAKTEPAKAEPAKTEAPSGDPGAKTSP